MRNLARVLLVGAAAGFMAVGAASPAFAVSAPSVSKSFGAVSIPVGGSTSLTITITNPDNVNAQTGLAFTDTLPGNLVIATPSNLTSTCGGVASTTAGTGTFSLSNGSLPASGSCTVGVNVTGTSAATSINSVTISSTNGGTGNTATATLFVVGPPSIVKFFGTPSIPVNGTTSLTFTITNPNGATAATGVAFTDTFPAGLVTASPSNLSSTCGGVTVANAGSVTLNGGSIPANSACLIGVSVTGTTAGVKTNTTSTVTSTNGGTGNAATATLTVTKGGTGVTLTSSQNPSSFGQAVTFTATVTVGGGPPTGTVTFNDGATALGTGTLAAGVATFATSSLSIGAHSITAVYGGDSNFNPGTSPALTQSVSVPADSVKLRALQLQVTKIEAQGSGAATSGAISGAIAEGFSEGGQPISGSEDGLHFNFTADPPQPSHAQTFEERAGGDFAGMGYAAPAPLVKAPPRPVPREWLFWADVRGTGWNTSAQTGDLRGGQTNGFVGFTRKFTPDFLVGVFGGGEVFDFTSQLLNGRMRGTGWSAGGYLGARLLPGLRFEAGAAYSAIAYDGTAGTAAGAFPGHRWIITSGLVGVINPSPGFEIENSARLYALWEHEGAYIDSLGVAQDAREFSTGRASAGTKVSYSWMSPGRGLTVTPYVGGYADYYFNVDDGTLPAAAIPVLLPVLFIQGWSARAVTGLGVRTQGGAQFTVGGEMGGIGSSQFRTWVARGRASLPF